jgi:hypothetical protein
LEILRWLIEERRCPLVTTGPSVRGQVSMCPVVTQAGETILSLAAGLKKLDIMHACIVDWGCAVREIRQLDICQRALEVAIRTLPLGPAGAGAHATSDGASAHGQGTGACFASIPVRAHGHVGSGS